MANNPYQPSAAGYSDNPPAGSGPAKAPTGLMVISIICLLLGLFGLFNGCAGIVSPMIVSFAATALEQLPEGSNTSAEELEAQKAVLNVTKEYSTIIMAIGVVQLVVALMLVVGSIFCLMKKTPSLLAMGTLAAAIFAIVNQVVTYFLISAPMAEKMKELAPVDPTQQTIQTVSAIVGVVFTLVFAGFYLYSFMYLKKDTVAQYFASTGR